MSEKMIFPEESYAINGACMEVYKTLGNGFLEAVYQECSEIEFTKRGILFVAQQPLTLNYQGRVLRQTYKTDFICYDKIIVELKAVTKLGDDHKAQVLNYLKATGFELGILVNFGHYPLLEIVRVANRKGYVAGKNEITKHTKITKCTKNIRSRKRPGGTPSFALLRIFSRVSLFSCVS